MDNYNNYNNNQNNYDTNGYNTYNQPQYTNDMYNQQAQYQPQPQYQRQPVTRMERHRNNLRNMTPEQHKRYKKILAIIGISTVALFIFAVVFLLLTANKSYEVNDFNKVVSAYKKVTGEELKNADNRIGQAAKEQGVVHYATDSYSKNGIQTEIVWAECKDEATAKEFYNAMVSEINMSYEKAKYGDYKGNSFKQGKYTVEMTVVDKKDKCVKSLVAINGNAVLMFGITGNEDNVKDAYKDFIKEIK